METLKRVFVTSRLPEEAIRLFRGRVDAQIWEGDPPPSPSELKAELADKHGLLCLLTDRVDENLLASTPLLEVVSNVAVGLDNIDLAACRSRGIRVGHTPGVLTEATADLTWGLILAACRRIVEADRFVRADRWKGWRPDLMLGKDLQGATLGIVGLGQIGKAVARRAEAFGVEVIATTRTSDDENTEIKLTDLDELLARSDVVSLHVPLTEETVRMIGPHELARMKRGAVLINTSRGAVIDETALAEALRTGHLFSAGLDVFEAEPLEPESPLLGLENVVLAPHIGSATEGTRLRMAEVACENLLAGLEGRPLISEASGANPSQATH